MPTLGEAREALAEAITDAGLKCVAYPADNLSGPIAFVDTIFTDFTGSQPGGGYFCLPGLSTATVISIAQRHDRPGGIALLEGHVPAVLEALRALPGIRIATSSSGSITLAGQDLPAVVYTVQFSS